MTIKKAFRNSAEFAVKTLWAVLIVVPSTWLLIGSLKGFGLDVSRDIPSWVQAFGSIAAIMAAGYFPIAHENRREKRERCDILRTLSYFAIPLESLMQRLSKALLAVDDRNRWLSGDWSRELDVLGHALDEMPASIVVAFELNLLTDLKFACGYAIEIDNYLQLSRAEDISGIADDIRYYNLCENCISKIRVVIVTLDGLILSNS